MADQLEQEYVLIKEGQAEIFQPKNVFFNKVQEFNRDLSVLALNTYIGHEMWTEAKHKALVEERGIRILDSLSATGLRSIRYGKEIKSSFPLVITANDLSAKAVETIKKNVEHNGLTGTVTIENQDATTLMYMRRKYEDRFLIIDVDPYGSAAPFIDAAIQSITDGGMLMVTATDLAILCGNHHETCYAKYGSMSMRIDSCHEMALRIVLKTLETAANRYGRIIKPLLSMSADFYIRIFVQVFSSPIEAKNGASKSGYVYICVGCQTHTIQPAGGVEKQPETKKVHYSIGNGPKVNMRCEHCESRHNICGPIWIGSLHNTEFLKRMQSNLHANSGAYKTFKRIEGMLAIMDEELPDVPLFYAIQRLCRTVHCRPPPSDIIRSAILNAGYRVSSSHCNRESLKTDAPQSFLWDLLKKWIETHPVELDKHGDTHVTENILAKPISSEISFELHEDAIPPSKRNNLLRYQVNPEPNWGPKNRASIVSSATNGGNGGAGGDQQQDNDSAAEESTKKIKLDVDATA